MAVLQVAFVFLEPDDGLKNYFLGTVRLTVYTFAHDGVPAWI